jgi:hypothetical protein
MRNPTKPPPPITDHRLARFLTLVWLRLLRMAGRLLVGEAPHREDLNAFSRFVASFLIIRAARSMGAARQPARTTRPASAPPGFNRRKLPAPFAYLRAAVGSKLRRRLRGRTALAHISALIAAILNLDALTAAFAKRLQRGLTRLRPLVLMHAHADVLTGLVFAREPHAQDSS